MAKDRKKAKDKITRAFLNRSHEALRSGQAEFARACLARAWELSPAKVIGTVATDPRLCTQLATLAVSSRLAQRWFGRDHGTR
jgi:hypothetical protein